MITASLSRSVAEPRASVAKRPSAKSSRANYVNRLYVLAMFATLIAIGSIGPYAFLRSEQSGASVERSFQSAQEATEMGTALDTEYSELLSAMRQHRGEMSDRFVQATKAFDTVPVEAQREGWARNESLFKALVPSHAAFVADSRAVFSAMSAGDNARAIRIEADHVRRKFNRIRFTLDLISNTSYRTSVAMQAKHEQFTRKLWQVIAAITIFGVALVTGFAVLLGCYKRSAEASSAATLVALEQAQTDKLTGLGNNRAFYDDFDREIARAKRHGLSFVLGLIDVDDFKAVNDNGGHSHGDVVLARIGDCLRTMRQEDRGYRIGGDEFAVILVETDAIAAGLAFGRLQGEISESGFGATVSIGYVNLSGERLDGEAYELADTALYEAKRMGRNQTVCFDNVSGRVNVFSPRKAEAVRTMIAQGLVSTAFQPIWDMQSTRPLGFEALARPLPELGLSGPQEAFDIAERMRQLPQLDRLCTRKVLQAAVNLPAGSDIFLNYSPASLAHASFDPKAFVATVRAAGLLPEQIIIELTERRIDDPTVVAHQAAALRALGLRIALDDTGSGHAGLEILSKVRFDFVKIDRELVMKAMESSEARGVLAGIVAIARETKSYLIAEGIETEEMLDFVNSVHIPRSGHLTGVRGVQGYLLGRPKTGRLDLGSLERHHDFLAARDLEERRVAALVVTVVRGEDSGAATPEPSLRFSIA